MKTLYITLTSLPSSPRCTRHIASLRPLFHTQDFHILATSTSTNTTNTSTQQQQQQQQQHHQIPNPHSHILRIIVQTITIIYMIITIQPKQIIVATPPAVPVLAILYITQKITRTKIKYIIDWHNIGTTILETKNAKQWKIKAYGWVT